VRFWLVLTLILWPQVAAAQQRVDLELVLAIDTSTSVDTAEFELQRQGLALAFTHPDVVAAIRAIGNKGIAVQIIHWAGQGQQAIAVDWTHIRSPTSATNLAAQVLAVPRLVRGFTDIAGAIQFASAGFASGPFKGTRQVIDVSGDGTASADSPRFARDQAVARGITINGLVILTDEVDLGTLADDIIVEHFHREVIGGPGAFVMVANSFDDFAEAIQRKLVREILGLVVSER
jgi:hypothetical protein